MFARISIQLRRNGTGRILSNSAETPLLKLGSTYFLETHRHYSTAASNKSYQKAGFLEEFLVSTLGFSKEEAISTLSKVPRLKPIRKDPNLVVNFFENLGLNKSQIKCLIRSQPNLIFSKVDKTLKPKVEYVQELGLSGLDLVNFIMANVSLFDAGLESYIKPRIEYLKKLLGTEQDKLGSILKKSPPLLDYHALKNLEKNISSLRNIGISDKLVLRLIIKRPRLLLVQKDGWFEDVGRRVKYDLGIPSNRQLVFYYAVETLSNYKQETLDAKYAVLRSFGWTDEDIGTLVRVYPLILAASEKRLRKSLDFLMNVVGYSPNYLASRGTFFSLCLEKRVILRYEVLKALGQKDLKRKTTNLYSVIGMPEARFVKVYILPYKKEMPEMYKLYLDRISS